MYFPISGVECSPFLPPAVAFVIAALVTSAGVSGAFLILPFQMSVLGFTSPAVSATNLLYNIVAIPLAAGILAPFGSGFLLSPALGALFMSLSTVIVAINAQTLRRVQLGL